MTVKRIAVVVWLMLMLMACTQPKGKVFVVLFAEAPEITDNTVCDTDGNRLARIIQTEVNKDNSVRIQIGAQPDQLDKFTRNLAFVVSDGRLQAVRLGGDAEPLSPESRILGFSSAKSLLWFKLKTIMGNTAAKAAELATEIDGTR